jgi:antitoxin VapB
MEGVEKTATKDAATKDKEREVAKDTDATLTEAIVRTPTPQGGRVDREKLAKVLAHFRSLPKINEHLTDDQILRYDDRVHADTLQEGLDAPTCIGTTAAGRAMAIIIEDEVTTQFIRLLAERTGESIEVAVRKAIEERLQRNPWSEEEIARRKRELAEMFAYFDSLPRRKERLSDDELVGYDEYGLPV